MPLPPGVRQIANGGQSHSDNGAFRVDDKYDNSSAPATFGNSSISSPSFGAVTPTAGSVGQNRFVTGR